MGKINKGILGGLNGKVGTVVGFAWLLLKLLFVQNRDLSAFHFDGAFGNQFVQSPDKGVLLYPEAVGQLLAGLVEMDDICMLGPVFIRNELRYFFFGGEQRQNLDFVCKECDDIRQDLYIVRTNNGVVIY